MKLVDKEVNLFIRRLEEHVTDIPEGIKKTMARDVKIMMVNYALAAAHDSKICEEAFKEIS